jgi:hypothetical protein
MKKVLFKKKQDKIMKQTAVCGKWNRNYAACLKNAADFVVA